MLTLSAQDNGRHLSMHQGDEVTLHLPENASTGYRWAPDRYNQSLLELLDSTGSYPDNRPGSAGEAVFRFRAIGLGSGELSLKYWRHWEGAGSVVQRFAVTIDVGS